MKEGGEVGSQLPYLLIVNRRVSFPCPFGCPGHCHISIIITNLSGMSKLTLIKIVVNCRYSPDTYLLKLQKIAQQKHLGCIWSRWKKNMVLGAKQLDYSDSDESSTGLQSFDIAAAESIGFPLKVVSSSGHDQVIRLQPWHERRCKIELEKANRCQYREHQKRTTQLPYGFVIDMYSGR